jgi:hypothetical protein
LTPSQVVNLLRTSPENPGKARVFGADYFPIRCKALLPLLFSLPLATGRQRNQRGDAVINLTTEAALSLAAAAKLLPPARNGRRCHLSTILRWVLRGAKAPDGTIVRLEACRVGSRWLTSREALQRFSERLTPRLDTQPAPAARTHSRRRRAAERAAAELERRGV